MSRSLQLLLLVAVAACYRNPEPESQASCSGSRFAVVSNNWNRAVDVYAWQNGKELVIGTVTAGSSGQFPVPGGVSVSFRAEGGGVAPSRGPTSPIQTHYICR